MEDFYGSVSLRFCFPADLAAGELAERWNNVEQNWERLAVLPSLVRHTLGG